MYKKFDDIKIGEEKKEANKKREERVKKTTERRT